MHSSRSRPALMSSERLFMFAVSGTGSRSPDRTDGHDVSRGQGQDVDQPTPADHELHDRCTHIHSLLTHSLLLTRTEPTPTPPQLSGGDVRPATCQPPTRDPFLCPHVHVRIPTYEPQLQLLPPAMQQSRPAGASPAQHVFPVLSRDANPGSGRLFSSLPW